MRTRFFQCRFTLIAFLIFSLAVGGVSEVNSASLLQRGMPNSVINQLYLYAERAPGNPNVTHKGIDIPVVTGTNVFAVSTGVVVEIRENVQNDTAGPADGFGNFVLMRLSAQHYIRQNNGVPVALNGYVYVLYAHLAQNSVIPNVGDTAYGGIQLAQVDNTGFSTGAHLHIQIMLHQLPDRTRATLGTETVSRNPEAWLLPYTGTATAIGRVSDINGNPVGDLKICGLQKPAPANYNSTFNNVQTYAFQWANPDDILVENFATTDVQPGTYQLYARNGSCNGTVYRDLGVHSFYAGRTTYIGLYPVYLPDIRANSDGSTTAIVIRNDNEARTAQVTTTFFWSWGAVREQRNNTIAPRGSIILYPPTGFVNGPAMVVGSEPISVVAARQRSSPYVIAAYSGIANPAQEVRLPLVHRNNSGWNSDITIMNTDSGRWVYPTLYFQSPSGEICPQAPGIPPSGSYTLSMANISCLSNGVFGVRIFSDLSQPLAIVTTQYRDDFYDGSIESWMDYEGFASAFTPNLYPLLMRGNSGWDAGIMLQNPHYTTNQINISYFHAGSGFCCSSAHNVGSQNVLPIYPLPSVPSLFVGSGRASSLNGPPLVFMSVVNQVRTGSPTNYNAMSFSTVSGGTPTAAVPLIMKGYNNWLGRNGWHTGISVQNLGSSNANVTVRFYSSGGSETALSNIVVAPNSTGIIYPAPVSNGFIGSAWVTANQPIAVATNHVKLPEGTEDTSASHGGVNR